jgi:hypothetical protein
VNMRNGGEVAECNMRRAEIQLSILRKFTCGDCLSVAYKVRDDRRCTGSKRSHANLATAIAGHWQRRKNTPHTTCDLASSLRDTKAEQTAQTTVVLTTTATPYRRPMKKEKKDVNTLLPSPKPLLLPSMGRPSMRAPHGILCARP